MVYLLLFLMAISLSFLIYFTYTNNKNSRATFKIITSLFFIAIAINAYLKTDCNFPYFSFIFLGLIFSLFGDVFLIFEDGCSDSMNKFFIYGLLSFSVAHIFFTLAFVCISNFYIYDILIVALFTLFTLFILKSIKKFNFKGAFKYVSLYTFIISFMLIKSISLCFYNFDTSNILILVLGSILFVISDIILSFVFFYEDCHKSLTGFNLLFYYVAQALIALSIYYI